MIQRLLILTTLGFALTGGSIASPSCTISEFGLLGLTDKDHASIFTQTDSINAKVGVVFGVGHKFENIPDHQTVNFTITFSRNANGPFNEVLSAIELPNDFEVSYFKFDEPKELRQGYWMFTYKSQGVELCSKLFYVKAKLA